LPSISWHRAAGAALAAGACALLLALPVLERGFVSWQPRTETLTPADGSAQSFELEFDDPALIELPAQAGPSPAALQRVSANLTVLDGSSQTFSGLPVAWNESGGRLRIRLPALHRPAGTRIRIELNDPGAQVWLWGVEDDAYPAGSWTAGGQEVGGDLAFRVEYRRRLLDVVLDGFAAAQRSVRVLGATLAAAAVGALAVTGVIRRSESLDLAAILSAGISGGLAFAALLAWCAAVAQIRLSAPALIVGMAVVAAVGAWLWLRPPRRTLSLHRSVGCFAVLLFGAALLRLAFAAPLALPPHVDSVGHFATVSDLLAPGQPSLGANPVYGLLSKYYHIGFHALAAWVMILSGSATPYAMMILAQVLQAAAVGAVYFPVFAATRDWRAGISAVVLATVAWVMPGYASNWAKYPALLALTVIPFVVGMVVLATRESGRMRRLDLILAILAAVASVTIHTRTVFVLAAFLGPIALFRWVPVLRNASPRRLVVLAAAFLGASLLVGFLAGQGAARESQLDVVSKLVEGPGGLSLVAVLLLAVPAARRYPRPAAAALSSLGFLFLLFGLPANPVYPFPLLDQPMVSMVLYLPLSFLGGLGVGAIVAGLDSRGDSRRLRVGKALLGVVFLVYGAACLSLQSFSPGSCCVLARADDLAAIQTASEHLPADARILIPYFPDPGVGPSASDGGAWLWPLARRPTVLWPVTADFTDEGEHAQLCLEQVTAIYAGDTPYSFSRMDLDRAPGFYAPLIQTPGVALYSLLGCEPAGAGASVRGGAPSS
jgi:hypothetical protein